MPDPIVALAGNLGAKLQQDTRNFNPETGFERVSVYSGPKASINGLFNAFCTKGYICSISHEGPLWKVTAQLADNLVLDRWERTVEWAQVDLLQTPGLFGAIDVPQLAKWNADIDHTINITADTEEATLRTTVQGWATGKQQLYRLKSRGMTSFEIKRYVLRMRRTVPPTAIATADTPDANESVYSTASLIDTFKVPDTIAAKLPATPSTTPIDTQWGWKFRTDDVEFIRAINRAQQLREWVFAAWPTSHYTFV
jgi:hypothetical protein